MIASSGHKQVIQMEEIKLTQKEQEQLKTATDLAESGNGTPLCELLQDEKNFDKHTKIINEMLSLNQQHIKIVELEISQGKNPSVIPKLNFEQTKRTENGQSLVIRSLTAGKEPVFQEVYDSSNNAYLDSGSCMRPHGIVPRFIPANR